MIDLRDSGQLPDGVRDLRKVGSVRAEVRGRSWYWAVDDDRVLVAPRLRDLVAALPRAEVSVGALSAMAERRGSLWITPFVGVHRLTFGHELAWTPAGPRVTRWLTAPPVDPDRDPVEVLRDAIERAVAESVAGQAAVSATVSGGLDSTVVSALAAGVAAEPGQVTGYCASPFREPPSIRRDRLADEWPLVADLAAHTGNSARRLTAPGHDDWLDLADGYHSRHLRPLTAPTNAWWLAAVETEALRAGHSTILTGQSGNATFSTGPCGMPQPLQPDGSRRPPPGVRAALGRALERRSPPNPCRPGIPVQMPDHILALDPWTRWCLVESPTPADGPWTGGAVTWADPLGAPGVVRAAWSIPRSAWLAAGPGRAFARESTRGLLPESVRTFAGRGLQGADAPWLLAAHSQRYRTAIDRVCQSRLAAEFLDIDVLARSGALLAGGFRSALAWQNTYQVPLSVGLFAAWWEDGGCGAFAAR